MLPETRETQYHDWISRSGRTSSHSCLSTSRLKNSHKPSDDKQRLNVQRFASICSSSFHSLPQCRKPVWSKMGFITKSTSVANLCIKQLLKHSVSLRAEEWFKVSVCRRDGPATNFSVSPEGNGATNGVYYSYRFFTNSWFGRYEVSAHGL